MCSLTEEIRSFAASLPGWLKAALKDLPELLVKTKEKGLYICVCLSVRLSVCLSTVNICIIIHLTILFCVALELFCKRIKRLTSLVQLAKVINYKSAVSMLAVKIVLL